MSHEETTPTPPSTSSGIDALLGHIERLDRELTELRAEIAALRAAGAEPAAEPREPVRMGRRTAIRSAVGAAVGAGVALAVLDASPAAAANLDPLVLGRLSNTATTTTWLRSSTSSWALSLENTNRTEGHALRCVAERGQAVLAQSVDREGVIGSSIRAAGVEGISSNSNGVVGRTNGAGSNPFNGVYGVTTGSGNGVFGESWPLGGNANGVLGIANGEGNSVFGYKPPGKLGDAVVGFAAKGRGVFGVSTSGRGVVAQGEPAQLQLVPSAASTKPATGLKGDLFVDSGGRLWFCRGGSNWKQLA